MECLERMRCDDTGGLAFIDVDVEQVLKDADRIDAARQAEGSEARPLAGIPIAIKDLFDVAGQTTRAGSLVLNDGIARHDSAAVAALREAGFLFIGRSNMTEFAFSGIGINPHFGTPTSPWRPQEKRLAGGSTSGGAMAVALGMAHAALGSDTGGSCRIPAAWCGLVGFKPTASRIPKKGMVPLSYTLDSIGSIARSVACCATIDSVLANITDELDEICLEDLHLAVVENIVFEGADQAVTDAFENGVQRIIDAGCRVSRIHFEPFDDVAALNAAGGFAAAEAWAWHRERLEVAEASYDPRVAVRIRRGESIDAVDYDTLVSERSELVASATECLEKFDALLMPTTPILPPRLESLADDDEYGRVNLLALRNPTLINMIDGCAVSVPVGSFDNGPVGLSLAAAGGMDRRLLAIAHAIEAIVSAPCAPTIMTSYPAEGA